MEFLEMPEAEKLVRSIHDRHNASAALNLRDKWLHENDLGVLHMAANVRALLENAFASAGTDPNP
jgi:hypothetical protein